MEEGFFKAFGRYPRVVITGPESTGKTELTEHLALEFQGLIVTEYARSYVEDLKRPYKYKDLVRIARQQVKVRKKVSRDQSGWVFFDTDLVITRVWFEEVYNKYPAWLDRELKTGMADLYLLCNTDVP